MSKYQETYPEGIYKVKVIGNTLVTNTAGDHTYPKLKVEVLSLKKSKSRANGDEIKFGGHRYVNLYTTERTRERTIEFLLKAGFGGYTVAQLDPEHKDHIDLSGFEFDASCQHEEYGGKTQDKFNALPVGGGESNTSWMQNLNKPTRASVANLDALFGSALKSKPKPAFDPKALDKDDVPF